MNNFIKWLSLERIAWILLLILLTIMCYNVGAKLGSTHTIEYKYKPAIVETTQTIKYVYTEAKVDTSVKPAILMDSLALEDIMKGMYAKFVSTPVYDDKHNLKYLTKWEHNIAVVHELSQITDSFKIVERVTNWNLMWGALTGGCLMGGAGGLYTGIQLTK